MEAPNFAGVCAFSFRLKGIDKEITFHPSKHKIFFSHPIYKNDIEWFDCVVRPDNDFHTPCVIKYHLLHIQETVFFILTPSSCLKLIFITILSQQSIVFDLPTAGVFFCRLLKHQMGQSLFFRSLTQVYPKGITVWTREFDKKEVVVVCSYLVTEYVSTRSHSLTDRVGGISIFAFDNYQACPFVKSFITNYSKN